MTHDIFISYKRAYSEAAANNLYYRLTVKGYKVFFDQDELRRCEFNKEIFRKIDEAKDFFVFLEEGSLDSCFSGTYKTDWFIKEITYAIEANKNIIPVMLYGYEIPEEKKLPIELRKLTKYNYLQFSFQFIGEYIERLINDGFITAPTARQNDTKCVFKFYSNANTIVRLEGSHKGVVPANNNIPFYCGIDRPGEYRFECLNDETKERMIIDKSISKNEERIIDIKWDLPVELRMMAQMEPKSENKIETASTKSSLCSTLPSQQEEKSCKHQIPSDYSTPEKAEVLSPPDTTNLKTKRAKVSGLDYDGGSYTGETVDGKPDGSGRIIWKDRCEYIGRWKKGMRSGRGQQIFSDGKVYEGNFRDGQFCGYGTLYDAFGNILYRGSWENGKEDVN